MRKVKVYIFLKPKHIFSRKLLLLLIILNERGWHEGNHIKKGQLF